MKLSLFIASKCLTSTSSAYSFNNLEAVRRFIIYIHIKPLKTPVLNKLTKIAAIIKNGIVLKIEKIALIILGITFNLKSTLVVKGNTSKAVNNARIVENNAIFIVSNIGCFNSFSILKSIGNILFSRF